MQAASGSPNTQDMEVSRDALIALRLQEHVSLLLIEQVSPTLLA